MKTKIPTVSIEEAVNFLRKRDNFYILTHQSPDGDAIGSGFGLCFSLRAAGKRANVLCSDPFPPKYDYITSLYEPLKFSPETVVSVDLADTGLFGRELSVYSEYVELAIDHHISNTGYAAATLLDPKAAAACEILYKVLEAGNFPITKETAMCLYTGLATDTGCFKFENTTPETHLTAAALMRCNIPCAVINRRLFDIKSKARLMAEQMVLSSVETFLDGKCAIIAVTLDIMEQTGLSPEEFEGMAAIPMQIEGVEVGVTIKEKEKGRYKISLRSTEKVNVSDICAKLGGGGHPRAAGCTLEGDLEQAKLKLLSVIAPAMGFDLWLS